MESCKMSEKSRKKSGNFENMLEKWPQAGPTRYLTIFYEGRQLL